MTTYITMPKPSSGGFTGGPLKAVMHTTEVWGDPRNWIPAWTSSSHEVWDFERDLVVRCVDLTLAAKTLWNNPGGVETNRDGAIQVEVNGFAVNPSDPARQDWSDAKYRWCAVQWARLARELNQRGLGTINFADWRGDTTYGGSASEYADQRMSFAEWDAFNGICGHNNVPENDHWDPGLLDMGKLSRYILEELGSPSTSPTELEDDDTAMNVYKRDTLHSDGTQPFDVYDAPAGSTILVGTRGYRSEVANIVGYNCKPAPGEVGAWQNVVTTRQNDITPRRFIVQSTGVATITVPPNWADQVNVEHRKS